jgi:GNAT superfamily N-acetyltransferase
MTSIIRRAKPDEAFELSEIALRSKAYWGYPDELIELWRPELEVTPAMIKKNISFIVEEKSGIQGFWVRPAVEELSDGRLFIEPDAIGKGHGRSLWMAVMEEAKKRELEYMTWEGDPNALGFYLKMGAIQIGSIESKFVPGRLLPILRCYLETQNNR